MREPPHHLYFDDRSAVSWQRDLQQAASLALADNKRLLIVVTHPDCGGSRALLERVFPKEEITEELRAGFVCVCSDTGSLEDDVRARMQQAPRHEPTPLCLYTDGEGRLLHSTVGGRPAAVFLRDLTEAHARR